MIMVWHGYIFSTYNRYHQSCVDRQGGRKGRPETENIKMKSTYYGRYPLLPALVYLCGFPCAIHAEQFRNTSGRVMSLFSVIIFPNSECTDIDGTKGNRKETIFRKKGSESLAIDNFVEFVTEITMIDYNDDTLLIHTY